MNDVRKIRLRNVLLLLVLLLGVPAGCFFASNNALPNLAPAIAVAAFELIMALLIVKAALQELRRKVALERKG